MDIHKTENLVITCAKGIAPYLKPELEQLGYKFKVSSETSIEITGSLYDAMRLNLTLRSAISVLWLLKHFSCLDPDKLYQEITSFPWEEIILPTEYITIVSHVDTASINNSIFVNQRAKDAIVDRLFKIHDCRPNSGPAKDNIVINLFWKNDKCWLYLNTSGIKLSKRGYRKIPHTAPMQETLAATLLLAAGYDGSQTFINPMCGSGTLAIEAALIALKKAPGLLRNNFCLNHIKDFDSQAWQALRSEISAKSIKELPFKIIASDSDQKAIEAAKKNAKTAGVNSFIDFFVCDFDQTPIPEEKGIIILNPEYGHRLGEQSELESTYKGIGDFFKNKCSGSTGYVFTGNLSLAKKIGLKASRRLVFFNARIECRLLEYPMYMGSKEHRRREEEK